MRRHLVSEPREQKAGVMRNILIKRSFHQCSRLCALKIDAKNIVLTTKVNQQSSVKRRNTVLKSSQGNRSKSKCNIDFSGLYKKYNKGYEEPSASDINSVNHFFNTADIRYEWSAGKFIDVPGEKLKEKYSNQLNVQEGISTKKYPGKTYVPFELVNGLPEVAFLGKSNAGKSTLLNNLTTDLKRTGLDGFARASRRAGFTKTLNSFNVGNRLRIIDTPGYGFNSSSVQGTLTMDYLKNRRELRRTFLLISAEQGPGQFDLQVIDFMKSNAIPFEIIFTKMDKLQNVQHFEEMLQGNEDFLRSTMARLIFTNSSVTKTCLKRHGIDLLRYIVLESCGLSPRLKPSRKRSA